MGLFYKVRGEGSYRTEEVKVVNVVTTGIAVLLGLIFLNMAFGPIYRVWSYGKAGEAELAQAEYNRQIKVREAQAALDSASLNAEAEIKRAEGVAAANKIVADGLGGPEGYLRYLYIDMLRDQQGTQTIYIPTEAGLPILEAGKR
jgi:hypothetical protein